MQPESKIFQHALIEKDPIKQRTAKSRTLLTDCSSIYREAFHLYYQGNSLEIFDSEKDRLWLKSLSTDCR